MKKVLVVVDMQNDFIDGSLGTAEAIAIVPHVVEKIKRWDGEIVVTLDTHPENYLETNEGKHLPVVHCVEGTGGHQVFPIVLHALQLHEPAPTYLQKPTFGSTILPEIIRGMNAASVELIGLCTDICVVSNALLLKSHFPEIDIAVDASCCAGVTPESHAAALSTMRMCQIEIIE